MTGVRPPAIDVPASPKVKTGAHLSWWRATLHPFASGKIDFYPRLGDPARSLSSDDLIVQINAVTKNWEGLGDSEDLDEAIDLAKASLAEAKLQTEYQDQKATRLLTVTTFLTALAGAFFGSFSTEYPLRTLVFEASWQSILIILTYFCFFLFLVSAILGALISFHATRTRFKYPAEATANSQSGPARSFLFFREMIGVTPAGWANSFVEGEGKSARIRGDLKLSYFKNYVCEAYLVAAKTADKLRYLEPAQALLGWALRFLLFYVLFLTIVLVIVPSTKAPAEPSKVSLAQPVVTVSKVPQFIFVGTKTDPRLGANVAPIDKEP